MILKAYTVEPCCIAGERPSDLLWNKRLFLLSRLNLTKRWSMHGPDFYHQVIHGGDFIRVWNNEIQR